MSEVQIKSGDLTASDFDLDAVRAVDTGDSVAVDNFLEEAAVTIQGHYAIAESAVRMVTLAAASATHVAIQAGRIPASGRAGEGQMDNAQFSRYLTGRDISPQEVTRWRNVARAVFALGVDPDSDLYREIAHKTPKGLKPALDAAVADLGEKTSKTAVSKAQALLKRELAKAAGDNGGNGQGGNRPETNVEKMSLQNIFANLTTRVDGAVTAYVGAETDDEREAALAVIAECKRRAATLADHCETATRTAHGERAKADAQADAGSETEAGETAA